MTEPTELYITKHDIQPMYNAVDNTLLTDMLSVPFMEELSAVGDMSTDTKMRIRMNLLAHVDAIEKSEGIRPTTAECRKMAKGKR